MGRSFREDDEVGAMTIVHRAIGLVGLLVIALVAFTVVFGSWYRVDQTERGVLLRNGAFVEVMQPGLHFKWPWMDSVYLIDMQTHTFHWEKVNSYSADQQPADMKISVTLHVAPDKVPEMYARFGGDYKAAIQRLIAPHVNQQVKNVFGQYTATKSITARGKLNADAAAALTQAISYDPVFIIEGVQVESIDFSPEYIKSIEDRMRAEVEVQKIRQNAEREKVSAEITVIKANAAADAVRAAAKAEADAIKLKGEAQASAIQSKGNALRENPSLVSLTQAERWDGKLPTTMVPGAGIPMLSLK
jgi:regulator of protease activity HflC (stomatin/prohibitin superfamily)